MLKRRAPFPEFTYSRGGLQFDTFSKKESALCHRSPSRSAAWPLFAPTWPPPSAGFSWNLNLHLHVLVLDGLYLPDEASGGNRGTSGALRFHDTGRPTPQMVDRVVQRIRDRVVGWLRRKGLLDTRSAEVRSNEALEQSALDACAGAALSRGAFTKLSDNGEVRPENTTSRFEPRRRDPLSAERDGFDVQAAVRVEADDDEGRIRFVDPVSHLAESCPTIGEWRARPRSVGQHG